MKLSVSLLILFLWLETPAQLMDWGSAQKLITRNYYCKYVGFTNEGYYYLRCRKPDFKTDVTIEKYSRSLSLLWSNAISINRQSDVLIQVLILKSKLVVLTSEEDFSTGFTEVKSTTLNFDGEFATQSNSLFQIKTSAFFSDDADSRFTIKINEKSTAFAVCYLTQAEKKQATINYNLFSENNDKISSGGYTSAGKSNQCFINDLVLYRYSIYGLLSYNEGGRKSPEDIFQHDLLIFNTTSKAVTRVPVILTGKVQSDLGLYIDSMKNTLLLTGFYSEKKSTSAAGIALYTLPLDSPENYSVAYSPFPREMISKIIGERASEKTKEMEDFMVNRIVPRSDGGMLLIAECFYIEKQPYNTYSSGIQGSIPQQTMIRNVYNYDEVLIFSIDSDARIDWWQVISKNQNSVNDDGYNLSVATLVKKDMVYVFFNIGYRNSNDIMEYSIGSNGKMKNKVLFKSNSYFIDFTPRQSSQVGTGSMIMPVTRDKKFNLLKLSY